MKRHQRAIGRGPQQEIRKMAPERANEGGDPGIVIVGDVLEKASQQLPECNFPTALEIDKHALHALPATLSQVALHVVQPYRSSRFNVVEAETLDTLHLLQLAEIVAKSFSINGPMARHCRPPRDCPSALFQTRHRDHFGAEEFGEWNKENILYWNIRLFALTRSDAAPDNICIDRQLIHHSMAIRNFKGDIIGGILNRTLAFPGMASSIRSDDIYIQAVLSYLAPIFHLLEAQEHMALLALCKRYSAFHKALKHGKVGNIFMLARSPELPKEDTFELVASTVERYIQLGFEYIIVAAANTWTGAACELLNGVRVHFAPYRFAQTVRASNGAVAGSTSSADGYISDKDSGCMLYVLFL
jgi:hypothetical protein